MTAKEYLGQAYRIEQRINCKLEQIKSLHDLAEKATSTLSDIPHSPNRNIHSMENVIVKLVDMENEINAEIRELIKIKEDIKASIQAVDDKECAMLLELRYISQKSWEDIAAVMGYSVSHTYLIHRKALRKVKLNSK